MQATAFNCRPPHLEALGRKVPGRVHDELAHGRPHDLDLGQHLCAIPHSHHLAGIPDITHWREREGAPPTALEFEQVLGGPLEHHEEGGGRHRRPAQLLPRAAPGQGRPGRAGGMGGGRGGGRRAQIGSGRGGARPRRAPGARGLRGSEPTCAGRQLPPRPARAHSCSRLWRESLIHSFLFALQWTIVTMFSTNVTIYHHLISQAGWNRYNLSLYLSLPASLPVTGGKMGGA